MKIIFHLKSMSRKSRWWVEKVISCSPISYISLWKTFQHDVFVTMSLECHLHDLLRRISMVLLLYNCVKMIFHPCVTQLYAFCFPQTFGICDIILHNWVNLIMWKTTSFHLYISFHGYEICIKLVLNTHKNLIWQFESA